MALTANQRIRTSAISSAEREKSRRLLVAPNPGDIIIFLVFGWALLCFFLVTVGDKLLMRIARLARNDEVQQILLSGTQGLAGLMVIGSVVLILTVVTAYKFPRLFLPVFVFGLTFGGALWKPVHDVAFLLKYLCLAYIGTYAILFLYKNFWKIINVPYVRLMLLFLAWIVFVCVVIGRTANDFWYVATETSLIIGLTIGWFYDFNNRFGAEEFFRLVAWASVAILLVHLSAPFLTSDYIQNGRFQSVFNRATGFSMMFVPAVLTMFWMSMAHSNPQVRTFFVFAALAGFALILWSGSRSPVAATLAGVAILWLLFRSPVFLVMLFIASLALAVQIIFKVGSGIDVDAISSRFESAETGRVELWAIYFEVAAKSLIYGYSPSGMNYALVGDTVGSYLMEREVNFDTRSSHNTFLGILLRFGLVGVVLLLALVGLCVARFKAVLTSSRIPFAEKRVYILPVALVPVIIFMCLFEDKIPGTGKGTFEGLMLYVSLFVGQVYGSRLLNEYDRVSDKDSKIETLEGLLVRSQTGSMTVNRENQD